MAIAAGRGYGNHPVPADKFKPPATQEMSVSAQDVAERLELCRWLIGSQAAPLLELAATWQTPQATDVARLRRSCSARQASLVLELVALRRRAKVKFSRAERMFFTTLGLEQSTDEMVAAYKAQAF
ncbi:MAG TPA: hypothetical protein VHV08_01440, partial [Pirellulales bacterium]|nr:hypothetical protein [Pirellulales bacterium]